MTWFSEQVTKDYHPEKIKSILLPEGINLRDFQKQGSNQGGACVYLSNNGRVALSYEKESASRLYVKCEVIPNNPNKHSFDIMQKPFVLSNTINI